MASYSAVIDLRVNGLEQLKEIEDRVKAVQNIQKRLKPIPSIFDRRASAEVKAAKEELSLYIKEVAQGTTKGTHFSKTLAGLNAQMRAFNTVAANANAGGEDFVNAITAAERASRNLTEAEVARLQVLNKIYTQQQGIGRTTATKEIIDLGKIIPKSIAGLELYEQQLREAQRQASSGSSDYRALAEAIAEVNRQLDIARGIGPIQGPALPPGFTEAGATGFPRSPISARPRAPQAPRRGSPLVGAAFPALFGAGPAGILGGFIGEFFGPLGGVVGSALGAPVDAFVASAAEVGSALRTPIDSFEQLAEKGLLASKSQEKYIQKLIEAGKVNEAAAVIQGELVKKIGAAGVRDLQNAGVASEKFNKTLAELSIQMQAAVAGPLTEFLTFVNTLVSSVTAANRQQAELRDFGAALTEADPAAFRQYLAESRTLAQKTGGVVDPSAVKQLQQKYIQKFNLTPGAVSSTVDQTAAQQAAAQTEELQKQVDLAGKQLSLVGLTLEKDGARYIAAAKAVAQQEYDNKLIEIKNSWIGKIFDAEKNIAMIRKANLELAAKNKQIDIEITQNAEMREKAALSVEAALYQQAERILLFAVKAEEFRAGEEASLTKQLSLHQAIGNQRKAALEVERTLALQEAAKNGTTLEVIKLYDFKRLLLQDELDLEKAITQTKRDQLALDKSIAQADALRQAAAPFTDLQRSRELEQQYAKTYLRLVTEGMLPAEAERIANFEKLVAEQLAYTDQQIEVVEQQILLTQATITEAEARGVAVDKLKEQLDLLNKQRKVIEGKGTAGPGKGPTDRERVEDAIAKVKGELNELANPINFAINGAFAIADAFQQAFQGLATGAMTAQEALSSFFKSVGESFVAMAAEIIAKQLVMIALQTLLKALGAVGGGGSKDSVPQTPGSVGGASTTGITTPEGLSPDLFRGAAAEGAYWEGGFQAFANGGMVDRPTFGLVGEGGEPEYIIPASKMRNAMNRYAAGARGSSVIPGSGEQAAAGTGGGTAVAAPIDVRYTVERINNVDYVTADQFRSGMQQAAEQGARRGEQRTLANLRQNTTTRRKLGL